MIYSSYFFVQNLLKTIINVMTIIMLKYDK
jgi:hypothetical protein